VHLATAATLAGYDAVVIDLDPQGSAANAGGVSLIPVELCDLA
jgi:cellulose biosynthesis protein BcsQ